MSTEWMVSEHLLRPGSLVPPTPRHPDFTESNSSDDNVSGHLGSGSYKPLAIYPPSYGNPSSPTPSKKSTFYLYDRGGTSRIIALGGLFLSVLFGISSIAVGVFIAISEPHGFLNVIPAQQNATETEM